MLDGSPRNRVARAELRPDVFVPLGKRVSQVGGASGDLANLVDADGFLELPLGKSRYEAGEVFSYYPYR